MSISDDDKKLFRDTVAKLGKLKEGSPPAQAEENTKLEDYIDRPDDETVSGDNKLSYFNPTLPHKLRKQLQKGQFDIEVQFDLHGLTVEEARIALAQFLQEASQAGARCVLLVHGKGRDINNPVLKNKINQWLPQSHFVLAFCSAQPKHGGTGAVYILLR